MKPTIKVSIGGYSFNLEEDSYRLINDYLSKLNKYFYDNPEGAEIVSDIELRMAELLRMRFPHKSEIVTPANVTEILEIMGSPKDFDDNDDEQPVDASAKPTPSSASAKPFVIGKNKLFRDPEKGIIGGVCSGLGYFFKIDPVIIRFIFIIILIFPAIFSKFIDFKFHLFKDNSILKINLSVILIYIILWFIMPKAKTLVQKVTMRGTNPSIGDIEDRIEKPRRKNLSSASKVIRIILNIIVGIISLSLIFSIIGIIAMFFGIYLNSDFNFWGNICNIFNITSKGIDLSMLLALLLPLFGLLYICLKFIFNLRFTIRDGIITLVAFIVWIGAVSYVGGKVYKLGKLHKQVATVTDTFVIETNSDTLYIKIPREYEDLKQLNNLKKDKKWNKYNYKNFQIDVSSVYYLPTVKIRSDSLISNYRVEFEKSAFHETKKEARKKAEKYEPEFSMQDSLLLIYPYVYNRNSPWNREYYKIIVTVPEGKTVKLDKEFNENNLFILNNYK